MSKNRQKTTKIEPVKITGTDDINAVVATIAKQIIAEVIENSYEKKPFGQGLTKESIINDLKNTYNKKATAGAFDFIYPENTPDIVKNGVDNAVKNLFTGNMSADLPEQIRTDLQKDIKKLKSKDRLQTALENTLEFKLERWSIENYLLTDNSFNKLNIFFNVIAFQKYALSEDQNVISLEAIKDSKYQDIQRIGEAITNNFGDIVGQYLLANFPFALMDASSIEKVRGLLLTPDERTAPEAIRNEIINRNTKSKLAEYETAINSNNQPFDKNFIENIYALDLENKTKFLSILDSDFSNILTGNDKKKPITFGEMLIAKRNINKLSTNTETYASEILKSTDNFLSKILNNSDECTSKTSNTVKTTRMDKIKQYNNSQAPAAIKEWPTKAQEPENKTGWAGKMKNSLNQCLGSKT